MGTLTLCPSRCSQLELSAVGLNPGRTLVLEALQQMGADVKVDSERNEGGEPIGTILVRGAERLQGVTISGDRIPAGIDEIPILALAGALCQGTFSVRDAQELRVKESDRLAAIANNLRAAGATVNEQTDGFDIVGANSLAGGSDWKTHGDHRLAMMGLVANLLVEKPVAIDDVECVAVSYPHFSADLDKLLA